MVVADLDPDGARRVVERIRVAGGTATAVEVDVARSESVDAMAKTALFEHGRIDVLVNNAGVRTIKGFLEHTEEDWNRMLAVNLTGPFLCSKAVLPSMLETGKGKIINLASIASFMGRPDRAGYVAAKTGLLGLTRAMAVDMAGRNVYVNAIAPGLIASPFNARFAEDPDTGPAWGRGNPRRPLGPAGGRGRCRRVSRLRRLGLRQRGGDQGRRRLARGQDPRRGAGPLSPRGAMPKRACGRRDDESDRRPGPPRPARNGHPFTKRLPRPARDSATVHRSTQRNQQGNLSMVRLSDLPDVSRRFLIDFDCPVMEGRPGPAGHRSRSAGSPSSPPPDCNGAATRPFIWAPAATGSFPATPRAATWS